MIEATEPTVFEVRGGYARFKSLPRKGWRCVGVTDHGRESKEACDFCCTPIRFEHCLEHDGWPEIMAAGCICSGHLTADLDGAKERERVAKAASSRRERQEGRAREQAAEDALWLAGEVDDEDDRERPEIVEAREKALAEWTARRDACQRADASPEKVMALPLPKFMRSRLWSRRTALDDEDRERLTLDIERRGNRVRLVETSRGFSVRVDDGGGEGWRTIASSQSAERAAQKARETLFGADALPPVPLPF